MSRADEVLRLLESAPRRTSQLVSILGCERRSVLRAIETLRQRGYVIGSYNLPGSHHGGHWVLQSRPHGEPRSRTCLYCGCVLARDHASLTCSPCERRAVDYEMSGIWGQTSIEELVTA